jgi:hypothetical protein
MGRRDHVQRVGSLGGSHPPPEIHIPDRPSCGGRPGRPARRRQQRRRRRQPFGRGHHLAGHFHHHHHHAHLPRHLPSPLRRCKCQTKPPPYPISPHETKPKFFGGIFKQMSYTTKSRSKNNSRPTNSFRVLLFAIDRAPSFYVL